jgi:hypothetical protein
MAIFYMDNRGDCTGPWVRRVEREDDASDAGRWMQEVLRTPPLSTRGARKADLHQMYELEDLMRRNNSVSRPDAFASWSEELPHESDAAGIIFWHTAQALWSSFDRIDHARFARLFHRFRFSRPARLVEHLPARIQLFRGQIAGDAFGLAWTASRTVAEGFARGHRGLVHDDPYVYEIIVRREEVAFTCEDRLESEVVLRRVSEEMVREAIDGAMLNSTSASI